MSKPWIVEINLCGHWEDAEWTEDDEPLRFASKGDADAAIDEFIKDQHDAVIAGEMTDKYDRNDYRAAFLSSVSIESRKRIITEIYECIPVHATADELAELESGGFIAHSGGEWEATTLGQMEIGAYD